MTNATVQESSYYIKKASLLAERFAKDAAERDKAGGTAKAQKDAIRNSGLLKVLIPIKYGGEGQSWSVVLRIVRELAKTDAALAHLYGYHFLHLTTPHFCGSHEQKKYYYTESAAHNWFWGNSFNPIEPTLQGKTEGDTVILNGRNTFSTGSQDSDRLLILWEENGQPYVGIVPTKRSGITINDDWDGMGQRQTDSGSVTFKNVIIHAEEIINLTDSERTAFSTFDAIISQIVLANVFVGSAEGALEEARRYTREKSRPWYLSDYEQAVEDPFIQRRYGDFWVDIQAAVTLVERAGEKLDEAWAKDKAVSAEERGEVVLATGAANVFGTKVALHVTSSMFEVMGARSATRKNNFDRFWRNVRTHSLHNPIEYKRKNIGRWVLTGEYPTPTDYS
jgi:alkylation response protein AidB-like acyl-CoA dehydrogenase